MLAAVITQLPPAPGTQLVDVTAIITAFFATLPATIAAASSLIVAWRSSRKVKEIRDDVAIVKADTAISAATVAEIKVVADTTEQHAAKSTIEMEKVHKAVNGEREQMMAEVKSLRLEILEMSKAKAAADQSLADKKME